MHITDKRKNARTKFEAVHEGEIFGARNDYFIKMCKLVTLYGTDYNCVSLLSGSPHYFNSDSIVERLANSNLIIN